MTNTVLITGASKGIGLAISSLLSKSGYQVIGIARGDIDGDGKFPGELIKCDLSDSLETAKALLQIKTKFPQIDCIINNVGIAMPEPLGAIDLNSLNLVFDLNVRTAVQITQAFIEQMKANNYGRIVSIASRAIFGVKNRSSYSAAKSALIGLTRTWALELASFGITVNAVSPGPTETELFRKARPVGSVEEKEVIAKIPLGRVGKPEEIAATVLFLLSKDASFITGQNICVDGGASL
jgi:NAD(P)-dependent dehydrogenase (short-subunit alcohol dehydrogenase family)